jgi:hypothetical protein
MKHDQSSTSFELKRFAMFRRSTREEEHLSFGNPRMMSWKEQRPHVGMLEPYNIIILSLEYLF